jgi:hypothetical protein
MRALESPTIDAVLARLPRESHGGANGLASAAPVRRRRGPQLAPRTAAERTLIEIWRAVFGADIGTDENYFELGVHSLALMQAHEQICAALKPDLPISALFQYPTVRELAAHLAGGPAGGRGVDVRARAQRQQQAVRRSAALAKPPESL